MSVAQVMIVLVKTCLSCREPRNSPTEGGSERYLGGSDRYLADKKEILFFFLFWAGLVHISLPKTPRTSLHLFIPILSQLFRLSFD